MLVRQNSDRYEYDMRGLVMSFFPGDPIEVVTVADEELFAETADLVIRQGEESMQFICFGRCHEAPMPADRRDAKTVYKNLIYDALKETVGHDIPWGTLTGIRPTKIPMALLEEGMDECAIMDEMTGTYRVSEEKAELALTIAKEEKEILAKIDYENGYSMYIGIPFCPSTCLYCSFTSYPLARYKKRLDDYLNALFLEMDATAEMFAGKHLDTIYIGGGTPTTLPPEYLDRLLTGIEERFPLTGLLEFTVEAGRPDSITREKLEVLKKHPVTRISINPQTMKDETLKILGRNHTTDQIREVYGMAREMGFSNINMDLIMGLPNETIEDVERTLQEILAMDPDNLTIHSLALKRAARLNLMRDRYQDLTFINTPEHMSLAFAYAKKLGMKPYYLYRQKNIAGNQENTGYAKPGKAGIYNILIMEEKQTIIALGAGSSTKAVFAGGRIERAENVKDVDQYIDRIEEMIERKRVLFT